MTDLLSRLFDGFTLTGDLSADSPALLRRHGRDGVATHVKRVAAQAQRIATRAGVPEESALTAAWLHDISQVLPVESMLEAALAAGVDVLPEERQAPGILHGKLSAVLASRFFGVTDPTVLDAIRCHSTLRVGATPLDKVLLAADKLSWDPADAPYYRDMVAALDRSLDDAVACFLAWAWEGRAQMNVVHPWLRQACREMGVAATSRCPAATAPKSPAVQPG